MSNITFGEDRIVLYNPVFDTLQTFCTESFPLTTLENAVEVTAEPLCIMDKQKLTFSELKDTVSVQTETIDDYYAICYCAVDYKGDYDVETDFTFSDVSKLIGECIQNETDFIARFLVILEDHEGGKTKWNVLQLKRMNELTVSWENCKDVTPVIDVDEVNCGDGNITIEIGSETDGKYIYIHNGGDGLHLCNFPNSR